MSFKPKRPKTVQLSKEDFEELVSKIETNTLSEKDKKVLTGALQSITWLEHMLKIKRMNIRKLKSLFGITTEKNKSKDSVSEDENKSDDDQDPPPSSEVSKDSKNNNKNKKKNKGNSGKNSASKYGGAEKVFHQHESLNPKDRCPSCDRGNLYNIDPGSFISIKGSAPITAIIHQCEKLRCSTCGEIFKAKLPDDIPKKKYDESADVSIALLKYGNGLPFDRLDKYQDSLKIPLPSSTAWERVEKLADSIYPVFNKIVELLANTKNLYIDDTTARILNFIAYDGERSGLFTTALIGLGKHDLTVYRTGNKHAGENRDKLLALRKINSPKLIQMSDALSRNNSKDEMVEITYCHCHARRGFFINADELGGRRSVLDLYSKLYKHEKYCKDHNFDDQQRLLYHQKHSSAVMKRFRRWCLLQFAKKKIEPNEPTGQAIQYVLNHWEKLTKFLRIPGVALDNNLCERKIKKVILHRKNSLFYKTQHGADVGDIIMSMIETCKDSLVNPFEYLVALHKNKSRVHMSPEKWLPWNYSLNS